MPNLASFHPQIVHFVVALLAVGIALRWLSLTGKVPFAGPACGRRCKRTRTGELTHPSDNPRLRAQAGMLAADALVATGRPDSARAVLRALVSELPMSRRLKDRLTQLGG